MKVELKAVELTGTVGLLLNAAHLCFNLGQQSSLCLQLAGFKSMAKLSRYRVDLLLQRIHFDRYSLLRRREFCRAESAQRCASQVRADLRASVCLELMAADTLLLTFT